jgi:hypothetical protein
MRLAISGTHSMGKSTLLQDCASAFPDFTVESEAYRSLRAFHPEVPIGLGKEADKHAMWLLTGDVMGKLLRHRRGERVFYDRGPADMIPYTLYAIRHGRTDLDQAFVDALTEVARIYCREFLEAILFLPMHRDHPIDFEDDGVRPTDEGYREEVDADFKAFYAGLDLGIPILEVVGSRQQRIARIAELLGQARPAALRGADRGAAGTPCDGAPSP